MTDYPTCIFCDTSLGPDTKPEHILLSALGGRKTTRRVLCTKQNEKFGSTIDSALAGQVAFIRNLLQLESGVGNPPPGLGKIQAGSQTVKIGANGVPQMVGKPFEVTPLGDGRFQVQIATNSVEDLERHLPHIAAIIGTTEQDVRAQLATEEATLVSQRPDLIHRSNPLGGDLECRAMVKACLILWATEVGNAEVKSRVYDAARSYVNDGGLFPASLDSRALPFQDQLVTKYGEFFNHLYVTSDTAGRVLAHFTLYNIVGWQFVLAASGGVPNRHTALVSNPLNPSDWSDSVAGEFVLSTEWLEHPDFEISRAHDRLETVVATAQHNGMVRELERIIAAVWEKHGLDPESEVSDPKLLELILGEIKQRVAYHMAGAPFEENISVAELLARKKQ